MDNRRMKSLVFFFAVLCVVARTDARDEFTLNGQTVAPEFLSVNAVPDTIAAGDVATVGGLSFVLGEPGTLHLHQLASDRNRLWQASTGGKRELLACRVTRKFSENGKQPELVNPLAKLGEAQLRALRGVAIDAWTDGMERTLAKLDVAKCFLEITENAGSGTPKAMPKLPVATRYLRIRESSSDNLKNLAALKALPQLQVFSYSGFTDGFDLALLAAAGRLRYLDITAGGEALQNVAILSKLTQIRTLGLGGLHGQKDASFLRGLDELRVLNLDRSRVEDLSALGELRAITHVDADASAVAKLPGKAVPTLVRFHAIGARIGEKEAAEFQRLNPQCQVVTGWQRTLDSALQGVTRIRVRSGGVCHRDMKSEKTLIEVKEPAAIAEIISSIGVNEEESGDHCMCCGEPSIEFYAGEKLAVTLGVHHGISLRWQEGWPADGRLIPRSSSALTEWLAKNGIKGPAEELARNRGRNEAAELRALAIKAILPIAVWDALQKATSQETAADAFLKNIADDAQRAEVFLRMFGCDQGSWSNYDQWDELVKDSLLPKIPSATLAKVKLEAGSQVANGLGRWLFFERKWQDWQRAELDAVFEVTAGEGLIHPREGNRRKTLLAIGGLGGATAVKLLTAVLRNEIRPRKLPDDRQAESGGMVAFTPEPQEIPAGCPDQIHAAIWLARMKDAPTRPEIEKLAATLRGKELAALKKALGAN